MKLFKIVKLPHRTYIHRLGWFVLLQVCMVLLVMAMLPTILLLSCKRELIIDTGPSDLQFQYGLQAPMTTNPTTQLVFSVDCDKVIAGDPVELTRIESNNGCIIKETMSDTDYIEQTANCKQFTKDRGYFAHPIQEVEREFPIAFSLLMYQQVEQAERLLRAIYRPHNLYCIHVDNKAPHSVKEAMRAIASCLDNVFLAPTLVNVAWGEISVLQAEITCLHALWEQGKTWKYFINLTGQEFPIRTNLELVEILKAYNGSNDVSGFAHGRPKDWTEKWWVKSWLPLPLLKRSPPPHGYIVHKGPTHVALSRDFVDFALHNDTAQDLMEWMTYMLVPDEHFFNTLNHSPNYGVPGAYLGFADLKHSLTRYKIWLESGDECSGTFVRNVCNFGAGDLVRVTASKALFANKFRLEKQPVAFYCMEKWYYDRVHRIHNDDFNITYYEEMPWAKYHV